jgi:hypothetical protein
MMAVCCLLASEGALCVSDKQGIHVRIAPELSLADKVKWNRVSIASFGLTKDPLPLRIALACKSKSPTSMVSSESSEAALASLLSLQESSYLPALPPAMSDPGQEASAILLKSICFVAEAPRQGDLPGTAALWHPQLSVRTLQMPTTAPHVAAERFTWAVCMRCIAVCIHSLLYSAKFSHDCGLEEVCMLKSAWW